MGEIKFSRPPDRLGCNGLGSCIGLIIFDGQERIGGLAHIMLPSAGNKEVEKEKIGKYADTAIPFLLEELKEKGAVRRRFRAKMAGGAHMFAFGNDNEMARIGDRNIEAVKENLEKEKISLEAMDVGGEAGRTIEFSLDTGELKIKTYQQGIKIL